MGAETGPSWVPTPAEHEAARKPNAVSCVLRVADARGHSLLLTGDIEREQELRLAGRSGDALHAEVLLVPHHGSRTSSTSAFVAAVAPRWVLFPVGYRNRFRHPHPDVWERWSAGGARLERTDSAGALTVQLTAGGVNVDTARAVAPRYWYGR